MAQGKKVLRCIRCGTALQSTKPNEKGYISPEILSAQGEITAVYCNDCYQAIQTINQRAESSHDDEAIVSYFNTLPKKETFIIYVIDSFTFSGLIDPEIVRMLKGRDFAVVGTKKTLFGSSFKQEVMEEFIKKVFEQYHLTPKEIFFVGKNDKSMDKAIKFFNENVATGDYRERDVFLIGNKNSGKSTLISAYLKSYSNQSNENVHIIWLNKNLKATIIPLINNKRLYELPDLSINSSILSKVEKNVSNIITPKDSITYHTNTLKTGDAVQIGSVAGLEIVKGELTNYRFYCASGVETKRVSAKKFDESFKNNMNTKDVRPVSNNFITLLDFDVFEFKFKKDGKVHEIAFEGLGFFLFKGLGQVIRICAPKGVFVSDNLGRI
ncbi:MAG: hypothetical protein MJZ37_04050 [Bacilli bacterium]|nr:hypothetical protein [Bacilli bacterium]